MAGMQVGSCDCTCSGFLVTCHGCANLALANVPIQVWTSSGGTLLGTQTTNSSGQISLAAGTYWLIASSGRLNGSNLTVSANTSVTFTSATGYSCYDSCSIPISNTLHLTDSVFGACTLTYSATGGYSSVSGWSGTLTGVPSTCCGVGTGNVTYHLNGPSNDQLYAIFGGFIASSVPTIVCQPSAVNISHTFSSAVSCAGDMYTYWCATTVTITVTE